MPANENMSAKELAEQIGPLIKNYVHGQVAARIQRSQSQSQPRSSTAIFALKSATGLRREHSEDRGYQSGGQSSQGRDAEIRDALKAHNDGIDAPPLLLANYRCYFPDIHRTIH